MKQVSAYYDVLIEDPVVEIFMDFFHTGNEVIVEAKVIDNSISKLKPIWGVVRRTYNMEWQSNDEIIFNGLKGRSLSRKKVQEMVDLLRKDVLEQVESEVLK